MYAVIRAGGKQYRVAPGDVIRVEKFASGTDGQVEFPVLAVSGEEGQVGQQSDARVVGQLVEEGRGAKILVFHYKRKKQYKKLRGHRQAYTAVRITEIAFGGQSFKAPELAEEGSEAEEGEGRGGRARRRAEGQEGRGEEEGCAEEGRQESCRRRSKARRAALRAADSRGRLSPLESLN